MSKLKNYQEELPMDKLRMESPDLTAQNIDRIAALFPNCITEMLDEERSTPEKKVYKRAVNFELLKQMLSPDVVDGDEAYEFTWVGKKAAIVEANKPIRKTLRPCVAESKNWDTTENLYIEGDNLEVLKLLQESYLGKVKMIYIDPPYNTGNDFIYADDFKMESEEWKVESGEWSEEGDRLFKNTDTNGRFHSDWCSMIYSRLLLARNLLADDGAIFIHIDENEVYSMSMICQEIFGQSNELGTIIWDKRNPKGVVVGIAYQHESILVYCKNISAFAGVPFLKKKENAEAMIKKVEQLIQKYGCVNDSVREEYKQYIKKNKSTFTGGESAYSLIDENGHIYQPVSMAAPDKPETRSHRPLIHPITGKPCPVPEKGWRFTDKKMDELISINKIEYGEDETTQPRQKYYLKENMEEAVSSLLYFGGSDDAMGLPFDNPKPVYVAKKLISTLCKNENDIILDFFSGSATTAHAVMQLNAEDGGRRKFIMVQLPEKCDEASEAYKAGYKNICEIGKERIRRAGEKILKEQLANNNSTLNSPNSKLDIGFRVLKLDSTNMKDVYYAPDDYDQRMLAGLESNIKDDRTDLDLLFGCLIDWGLPLSLPYKSEQIDGCTVHTYNDGDLIACFDANVPESVVTEIAKRKPLHAVFRDSGFASSPEKINMFEIFKLYMPEDAGDITKCVRVI
jgi:adenine-specific DNA-methyltransferase